VCGERTFDRDFRRSLAKFLSLMSLRAVDI
jgi:hypothetical protein